jgi:hypothetical protein
MKTLNEVASQDNRVRRLSVSTEWLAQALVFTLFVVLVLPRTLWTMPIVYGMPYAITAGLLLAGFALSLRSLTAMITLIAVSFALGLMTSAAILNITLSIATYSSAILLLVRNTTVSPEKLYKAWSRGLLFSGAIILVVGIAQLIRAGFPAELPYRDYSPDVFSALYGAGGPRLVTMILAPALALVVFKAFHARTLTPKTVLSVVLLVFGLVVPGSNATLLAVLAAAAAYLCSTVVRRFLTSATRHNQRFLGLRLRASSLGLAAITAIGLTATFLLVGSTNYSVRALSRFTSESQTGHTSPKLIAARETLLQLPRELPYQSITGVGLGNYSSWSQLLLSGVYADRFLQGRAAGLPISVNEQSWDKVLKYMSLEYYETYGRWYVNSIATQPWFSWQSLFAETGVLGLFLLALVVLPKLSRLRLYETDNADDKAIKKTLGFYAWFVFFMGFVDNYFEYPWLIAPFLLALALIPSRLHINQAGWHCHGQ